MFSSAFVFLVPVFGAVRSALGVFWVGFFLLLLVWFPFVVLS